MAICGILKAMDVAMAKLAEVCPEGKEWSFK